MEGTGGWEIYVTGVNGFIGKAWLYNFGCSLDFFYTVIVNY